MLVFLLKSTWLRSWGQPCSAAAMVVVMRQQDMICNENHVLPGHHHHHQCCRFCILLPASSFNDVTTSLTNDASDRMCTSSNIKLPNYNNINRQVVFHHCQTLPRYSKRRCHNIRHHHHYAVQYQQLQQVPHHHQPQSLHVGFHSTTTAAAAVGVIAADAGIMNLIPP